MILKVNPLFLLMLVWAYFSGQLLSVLCVFCVAVLHEAGHGIAALLSGYELGAVRILPFGVNLKLAEEHFRSPRDEMMVAAAGPAVNLLLLLIGLLFSYATDFQITFYIYSNIFMLLINLLPIVPLDGGRILRACLHTEFDGVVAEKVMRVISVLSTMVILIAGVVLLYKTKMNYSLMIAALFLLSTLTQDTKLRRSTNPVFSSFCVNLNECVQVKHYLVAETTKISTLVKRKNGHGTVVFDIVDNAGRYLTSLTNKEMIDGMIEYGYDAEVSNLVKK